MIDPSMICGVLLRPVDDPSLRASRLQAARQALDSLVVQGALTRQEADAIMERLKRDGER